MTLQLQKPEGSPVLKEVQAESVFTELGNGDSYTGKVWKAVTSSTRKTAPAPQQSLYNCVSETTEEVSVLVADKGLEAVFKDAPKQDESELCSSTEGKG